MTAPALPIVMAALQKIGGHAAAFIVTPVAGAALIWMTWLLGTRVRSRAVGLMSAWLMATSAPVLFMLMWPMTDIPATALAALMLWLLLAESGRSAAFAGLVAAIGILTRPNFVVTAAAVGGWLCFDAWRWRGPLRRWSRVAAFAAGVTPGIAITLLVNTSWYGSPIASGYGSASQLFGIDRVIGNTVRYTQWALASAPLLFVGLFALAVPIARVWRDAGGRRTATLLAAVTLSVLVVYLPYEPYDQWWYIRFLLPAWPALVVATAVAVEALLTTGRLAAQLRAGLVIAAGVAGVGFAATHLVFQIGVTERRYATIARLVDTMTEPDAVILTMPHSGTVRYYAGRDTLRYDVLNEDWIDRAIAWLAAQGRHPYVLLEDWEQPKFEARFATTYPDGTKPWAAVFNWQSKYTLGWVWLYDPLRRDRDVVTARPDDRFEDQYLCAPPKNDGRIDGR